MVNNKITMIKAVQNIASIKRDIQQKSQKRVNVRFSPGRNKVVCYSGVLSGVYPEIFTIEPDDRAFYGKTAYSYADILCGEVKITDYHA